VNLLLAILLFPAAGAAALFLVPSGNAKVARAVAFVATLGSLVLAVALTLGFSTTDAPTEAAGTHVYKHVISVPWVESLGLQFKLGVDGIGVAMVLLTAITIFTGVIVSFSVTDRAKEYYVSLLALVTGVFGVFTALDLFFYYFFYELAVIPMFLLIGCWGSTTRTMNRDYASMKLVLMLTTGAVLALVGLLAVYAQGPRTFDMVAIERYVGSVGYSRGFQMVWFPAVFLGFAALVPMWPLHSWSPGGHAAAPAAVSMLHAGVLMKLGAYGILRVAVTYMPDAAAVYLPWVAVLCCMNIVYGGLVAMAQRDMKFVVGYSSSSHMGYVLLGIATANLVGVEGAVLLMFAHGLMTALAFSLIGWFYDQTHTRMLDDLGGLMKRLPFVGTCFVLMTMASAGLPGFANFVSELLVIVGAWAQGMWLPAILATWGIVITGVYLLRTVKSAFFGAMPSRWEGLRDARTPLERLPYALLVAILLLVGFWPQPMMDVIRQGAEPLVESMQAAQRRAGMAVPAPLEAAKPSEAGAR
jgi:NADH-quinone oxidoreductase subunit M